MRIVGAGIADMVSMTWALREAAIATAGRIWGQWHWKFEFVIYQHLVGHVELYVEAEFDDDEGRAVYLTIFLAHSYVPECLNPRALKSRYFIII